MKDKSQDSLARPKRGDAGGGEMFFGVMFLGFALIGYLDAFRVDGMAGMLLVPLVLLVAFALGSWISRAVLRHAMQPRIGYAVLRRDAGAHAARPIPAGRGHLRWVLISAIALVAGAFIGWVVFARPLGAEVYAHLSLRVLGIGMFVALAGSYAFWTFFNGWREYPWKWWILLLIASGFVAIGVPVGGDYFQVWPQVMLFNGIVWLGSGVVTLCCYLRHAKPEPSAASSASAE